MQLEAEAAMQYRSMAAAAQADGVSLDPTAGYQDADTRQAAYEARSSLSAKSAKPRRKPPAWRHHPARRQRQRARHRLRGRYPQRGQSAAGHRFCRDPRLRVAYRLRRGIRLYPALSAGQAGCYRRGVEPWHWRYVGVENAPCHPRQRPELEEFHRLAEGIRLNKKLPLRKEGRN